MAFVYQSLRPSMSDEKLSRQSSDSSKTLQALDDIDFLSLKPDLDLYKGFSGQLAHIWLRSKWLWAVHAALLFTSCGILAFSLAVRSSTLHHVRQFSAWCESPLWNLEY